MGLFNSIKTFVVKFENGAIDCNATADKVCAEIAKEVESQAFQDSRILDAVNGAFAKMGNTRCPTPVIVGMAATILSGNDIAQMADWSHKVQDYLDRCSGFKATRGRKGGLSKA